MAQPCSPSYPRRGGRRITWGHEFKTILASIVRQPSPPPYEEKKKLKQKQCEGYNVVKLGCNLNVLLTWLSMRRKNSQVKWKNILQDSWQCTSRLPRSFKKTKKQVSETRYKSWPADNVMLSLMVSRAETQMLASSTRPASLASCYGDPRHWDVRSSLYWSSFPFCKSSVD